MKAEQYKKKLSKKAMAQVEADTYFCLVQFTVGLKAHFSDNFARGFNSLISDLELTIKQSDGMFIRSNFL